jgi:hypothetical protein
MDDRRDADAFRLPFYTGLRLGEVLTDRWPECRSQRTVLRVRRGRSAGEETLPKGRGYRYLPLSSSSYVDAQTARRSERLTTAVTTSIATARAEDWIYLRSDAATNAPAPRPASAQSDYMGSATLQCQNERRSVRTRLPRPRETHNHRPLPKLEASTGGARAARPGVCIQRASSKQLAGWDSARWV